MLQTSFIVPSWHYYKDPFKHQPYWELYYATVLSGQFSKENFSVDLFDLRGRGGDMADVVKNIPQRDFYFYWIFKSGDAVEIYSTAKMLKAIYPESIHVAGGTHVDMCTEECVDYFDAVVVGPGENSFGRVVEEVRAGRVLKKVYQQKYSEVPFADTPFPRRDFLADDKIANRGLFSQYGKALGSMVYFSRGCVYSCAFCVYNVPNALQVRSPSMMKAELDYLKERYKIEAVLLKDEVCIHPNSKISTGLCEVLGESGLMWRGQTTTRANYDQLRIARESGCQELAVGIETVDDGVMKRMDKGWQSQKQIREFIDNCRKVGIKIKVCLIFGLPGEPCNIVEKTLHFLEETKPEFVSLSGFCPLPGSPVYRDPKSYGIKSIDKHWNKHAHLLYRFSNEEEVGLPFEYEEEASWGKPMTREQIKNNIQQMQRWLEEKGMIY